MMKVKVSQYTKDTQVISLKKVPKLSIFNGEIRVQ